MGCIPLQSDPGLLRKLAMTMQRILWAFGKMSFFVYVCIQINDVLK